MTKLETIIGLEIHVQLKTKSKMFCSCDNNAEGKKPNSLVCPVCMAHPGTLPVINRQAVEWTVMTGLALNCEIPENSKFDRKNYFYPDLPKGYQISQYDMPLCSGGYLSILVDGKNKKINLERIHLEEDAGKLTHTNSGSLVDYNRTGTPLMEIVTKPDFRSAQEAKIFLQELRNLVRYINVSDADMEKGHLRCDANISLRPEGAKELSAKTELKNMNSFKAVEKALNFEVSRQTKLWQENDQPKCSSTRLWDDNQEVTREMRTKEGSHDYRYFPEPDLPPLILDSVWVSKLKQKLPELPQAKKERFIKQFGLSEKETQLIISNRLISEYFENVLTETRSWVDELKQTPDISDKTYKEIVKLVSNWLTSKLFALLNSEKISISQCKITAENFAELCAMLYTNKISSSAGQKVLKIMFEKGSDPSQVVEEQNLGQVSNEKELDVILDKLIKENPKPVADFKAGNKNTLQFFVGLAMKETKGKANPKVVIEILNKKLS